MKATEAYTIIYDGGSYNVVVVIDHYEIARALGNKARKNKSSKTSALKGLIKVRVVKGTH